MKNSNTIRNLLKVNFSKYSRNILGNLILIALRKSRTSVEIQELIVIAYKNDVPHLDEILDKYIILTI